MTNPSRIYSDVHDIDYQATLDFFAHRASLAGQVSDLSVTMYQDDNPEFVEERDRHEKQTVLPHLNIQPYNRVLDIGCGTGRWGIELSGKVNEYLGTDFSDELIEVGKKDFAKLNVDESFKLQTLSATEMDPENLLLKPPFDLFLIAGVLLYLNDEDVKTVLKYIAKLSAPESCFYLREPVAIENRLTLDQHFSDDLQYSYSAIYRTRDFYSEVFTEILEPVGFLAKVSEFLFPESLSNRTETAQHYWVLQKG